MATPKPLPAWASLLIDFGPVVAFYVAYRLDGIMTATIAVTVAAVVAATASRLLTGKISIALLITAGLAVVFGALTVALDDEEFVKIKSTVVNGLLGGALIGGLLFRQPLLKPVLAPRFPPMPHEGWIKLSRNFGLFFLAQAVINEVVRRGFSTDMWVEYNLWGDMALTVAFTISQMGILNRYMAEPPKPDEKAEIVPPQV